jgi:hypothetical protein
VVLGKPEPPAPPLDAHLTWPPGQVTSTKAPLFVEGFAYTARSVRWDERRLSFKIASREAWQAWCGLQRAYPTGSSPGDHACMPGFAKTNADGSCTFVYENDPPISVDCAKSTLCISTPRACACTANGCTAFPGEDISIDIVLQDGRGDGSIFLPESQNRNLRLTKLAR